MKPYIQRTLGILTRLLNAVRSQGTKSKLIVHQAVQDPMEVSLSLFPVYIRQPGGVFSLQCSSNRVVTVGHTSGLSPFELLDVIDSIMSFLLALFDSLILQVGPHFVERTTETVMSLFTRYSTNLCTILSAWILALFVMWL